MENNTIADIVDDTPNEGKRYNIVAIIVIIALISYFYSLLFGTTSAMTLLDIQAKKEQLDSEYNKLQDQNQKLQKKYFELIQLTPDDDLF